jgi:hypothetical protein
VNTTDEDRKIKVRVRKAHIDRGRRSDPHENPAAIAMSEEGCREVFVNCCAIFFIPPGHRNRINVEVPKGLEEWLLTYNKGEKVAETSFTLTY